MTYLHNNQQKLFFVLFDRHPKFLDRCVSFFSFQPLLNGSCGDRCFAGFESGSEGKGHLRFEPFESILPIGLLGTVALGGDVQAAFSVGPCGKGFHQPLLVCIAQSRAIGQIKNQRKAGVEFVDMLAAGSGTAAGLKLKTAFRDEQFVVDLYIRHLTALIKQLSRLDLETTLP